MACKRFSFGVSSEKSDIIEEKLRKGVRGEKMVTNFSAGEKAFSSSSFILYSPSKSPSLEGQACIGAAFFLAAARSRNVYNVVVLEYHHGKKLEPPNDTLQQSRV